jgi:hypothetical protein
MKELTEQDYQYLLTTAAGISDLKFQSANWYDITLCIASEPYRSQIDGDGIFREYQMLVRLLHNEKRELFLIDVCECGVNKLDQWPDKSKHPQMAMKNTGAVFSWLGKVGYPLDTNVRYYN